MMLGFLLARAGVKVVVLEKHADFFRDFRGDTVHPSTLELMYELGLIDEFLRLPHQKVETLTGQVGAEHLKMVDFRHVPTHCKFIALMPQWDFLNFLAEQAKRYKTFDLRMNAEATDNPVLPDHWNCWLQLAGGIDSRPCSVAAGTHCHRNESHREKTAGAPLPAR